MADDLIGRVVPSGGPVEPAYVIGREGDIADVCERLRERIHTMMSGDRRIGKTTVCNAACARLEDEGYVVVKVEVPERSTPTDLLQLIVERCSTLSRVAKVGRAARTLRPLIERVLEEHGVPLDLTAAAPEASVAHQRTVLSLPDQLARELDRPVIFYLDELQRAVDYADGEKVLLDLVDIYAGQTDVVVLGDGSSARTMDGLLDEPVSFGKLVQRRNLQPAIPLDQWRGPLVERFATVGLTIDEGDLETILEFGAERPYETTTAARHTAFVARRLEARHVDAFIVREGLREAADKLADDD
jgi:hypothetical protein